MDDFKLKSIEEFDALFFEKLNAEKTPTEQPKKESLIPEMQKDIDEPSEISFEDIPEVDEAPFDLPEQETEEEGFIQEQPTQVFAPVDDDAILPDFVREAINNNKPVSTPTPPQALYESDRMSKEPIVPFVYESPEEDDDYEEEKPAKVKMSTGALIGKIVSIIMLVATIVVFLLGCFVAIFLDNNGTDAGGYTFNTLATDIEKIEGVKKGDLIVAKKLDPSEYEEGDYIAVPGSTDKGCTIAFASHVFFDGQVARLELMDTVNPMNPTTTVTAEETYGEVIVYFTALGSIINFTMSNAILVCLLFILLAALWILLLVLIEKAQTKKVEGLQEIEDIEKL